MIRIATARQSEPRTSRTSRLRGPLLRGDLFAHERRLLMATICREATIARDAGFVWDAIRDVGAIHRRLVPGFVVDCRLEGDSRYITFANGMTIREIIVDVDDQTFRH